MPLREAGPPGGRVVTVLDRRPGRATRSPPRRHARPVDPDGHARLAAARARLAPASPAALGRCPRPAPRGARPRTAGDDLLRPGIAQRVASASTWSVRTWAVVAALPNPSPSDSLCSGFASHQFAGVAYTVSDPRPPAPGSRDRRRCRRPPAVRSGRPAPHPFTSLLLLRPAARAPRPARTPRRLAVAARRDRERAGQGRVPPDARPAEGPRKPSGRCLRAASGGRVPVDRRAGRGGRWAARTRCRAGCRRPVPDASPLHASHAIPCVDPFGILLSVSRCGSGQRSPATTLAVDDTVLERASQPFAIDPDPTGPGSRDRWGSWRSRRAAASPVGVGSLGRPPPPRRRCSSRRRPRRRRRNDRSAQAPGSRRRRPARRIVVVQLVVRSGPGSFFRRSVRVVPPHLPARSRLALASQLPVGRRRGDLDAPLVA